LRKNNERDAYEYLDRALRLDPNYYPALINFAQLKYGAGTRWRAQPRGSFTTRSPNRRRNPLACAAELNANLETPHP